MKKYMKALASYVKENPIMFDTETGIPCLEALWWHYAGFHPIHSDKSKSQQQLIREKLENYKTCDVDETMDLITSLCTEYERLAFVAGMKLGIQFMTELEQ